jgi:hypothetical protein
MDHEYISVGPHGDEGIDGLVVNSVLPGRDLEPGRWDERVAPTAVGANK